MTTSRISYEYFRTASGSIQQYDLEPGQPRQRRGTVLSFVHIPIQGYDGKGRGTYDVGRLFAVVLPDHPDKWGQPILVPVDSSSISITEGTF